MASSNPPAATGTKQAPRARSFLVGTQSVIEGGDYDQTYTVTNAQNAIPWPLQATGWLRGLYILVQGTGLTAGTTTADGPFIIFSTIQLNDVNNEALFGPFDGYTWFLTNKYGGYFQYDDPATNSIFALSGTTTTNNFTFSLYIPLEITSRQPIGPVASVNNSAALTVNWSLNATSSVFTTVTGTLAVRIRGTQDFYWEPRKTDVNGRPISGEPPASGTTQYWTQGSYSGLGGTINLTITTGLGYPWRQVLLLLRDSTGSRANGETNWPDPLVGIKFEANFIVTQYVKALWQSVISRMWDYYSATADVRGAGSVAGKENGLYILNFNADFFKRTPGGETYRSYLVTSPGSNFIFNGTVGSSGNTLYPIVNYVAPGRGATTKGDTLALTGGQ